MEETQMLKKYNLRTDHENFHNITRMVADAINDSGVQNGTCLYL